MKKMYAAISVIAAGILMLSFGIPIALGTENLSPHTEAKDNDHDGPSNNQGNETDHDLNVSGAAGGGWFVGYQGTVMYKITFGMFVSANESLLANNSFVLQGRNLTERIQSLNFTKVVLDNKTLEAWGWCKANGAPGFWFDLKVADGGTRSNDTLSLTVYGDTNNNTLMDETTPMWQWMANSLSGGNIKVGSLSESSEMSDPDDDYDSDD